MITDLTVKLVEKHFHFLIEKGYFSPSITTNNREISLVYKPAQPNQATLSIIYDGYGLPYVQVTPLWLKNTQEVTRTFALIEAIKIINPVTFTKLNHYSQQKNSHSQLDNCLGIMVDVLKNHSIKILSPDSSFVEKIELFR